MPKIAWKPFSGELEMETLHARRTLCYETQNTDPTLFDGCISFASSVDMYMVPFKR